jgi:hypothetical protein
MIEEYKINYHAHTRYSDGGNTLEEMARKAQELGHCCFVVTDHYYGRPRFSCPYTVTEESWLREVREAKEIEQRLGFPIFVGVEAVFARCEEINVFGFDAIMFLLNANDNSYETYKHMRDNYDCACILNHPSDGHMFLHNSGPEIIDGFEYFNHGRSFFPGLEVPEHLKDKKIFSNSDAHDVAGLETGYNIINQPVTTEKELIASIKNGPSKMFAKRIGHEISQEDLFIE